MTDRHRTAREARASRRFTREQALRKARRKSDRRLREKIVDALGAYRPNESFHPAKMHASIVNVGRWSTEDVARELGRFVLEADSPIEKVRGRGGGYRKRRVSK